MGPLCIDSLLPNDAIWQHRSGLKLAQVVVVASRHQAITRTNVDLPPLSEAMMTQFTDAYMRH